MKIQKALLLFIALGLGLTWSCAPSNGLVFVKAPHKAAQKTVRNNMLTTQIENRCSTNRIVESASKKQIENNPISNAQIIQPIKHAKLIDQSIVRHLHAKSTEKPHVLNTLTSGIAKRNIVAAGYDKQSTRKGVILLLLAIVFAVLSGIPILGLLFGIVAVILFVIGIYYILVAFDVI